MIYRTLEGHSARLEWRSRQPHPGTRVNSYRCSLPGLAEFTIYHCEGTVRTTIEALENHTVCALIKAARIVAKYCCICKQGVGLSNDFPAPENTPLMTNSSSSSNHPLLHSTIRGSGPTLLLLHGLFGSGSNLGFIARELVDGYTVHSLDLRNHGKSFQSDTMSYTLMAEDVKAYIDAKQLAPVNILGHSMGGKVAMELALNHPELIHQLIVADIAPVTYKPRHDKVLAGLQALASAPIASRQQADSVLAQHIEETTVRQFLLRNLSKASGSDYKLLFNLGAIVNNYSALSAGNAGTPFPGPTLFIKGELSNYITEQHRSNISTLFPSAQLKIISGTGHWLHAEKPQLFTTIVKRFLDRPVD